MESIRWRRTDGHWRPVALSETVAGFLATHQMVVGRTPGVVLSQQEERRLADYLKRRPYSWRDTPLGAVGRCSR
jgi:hypothetical protein